MSEKYQVAVYYFPNYHHDPQNEIVHGRGWNEWELVRQARPRYPGQRQPRIPLWGYEDESDPAVMTRKIDAAADHGVDAFLFDWYWYEQGPYLECGLESGFLGASNNQRLKFAIHWANHDWIDIHPASYYNCATNSHRLLYPGKISRQAYEKMVDHVIVRYFHHPSYWKIDGAPYFSIYDLPSFIRCFGGVQDAAAALAYFRSQARQAGFPDIHLNQVLWNLGVLPGEKALLTDELCPPTDELCPRSPGDILQELGFNSFTSYVWIHHVPLDSFPETAYETVCQKYLQYWEQAVSEIALPYFPNATMGWDSSPRTIQTESFANVGYPFTACMGDNTPARFKEALRLIKERMDQQDRSRRMRPILTINAWNEWTEGSYLEPDTVHGLGYLEAIRDIFGKA
jgi:hypothetical protein